MNAAQLSRGLGWFSIGLGLAELLAPRKVAEAIGAEERHENLLRLLGARELAAGIGILGRPKPTGFMWSRVAGDAMDLGLLAAAFRQLESRPAPFRQFRDTERRRLTIALAAVAGVTVLDLLVSVRLSQKPAADPAWRYTPAGGRSGLRRPIEVDRPLHLPVNEPVTDAPTSSAGSGDTEATTGAAHDHPPGAVRSTRE